ncbi:class I SAM-dependent methyltransferase [Cuniculiplasma sp. SKW3]|uniref:class I SAM-dependent methyltransferase n=1 Tax=unclassified Cuniculiplasma TaxID=2619706 RepID=UPI003FD3B3FF
MSEDLYLEGEEKFGFFTSRGYSISRLVPTMRHFYDFVLKDLKRFQFQTVLDIGSGDGYVLSRLAMSGRGQKYIGIDPSPHMVYVSSKKWKKIQNVSLQFIMGSSRQIPDGIKADLIYTTLSFHHWKDRESAIPYIMKHLNTGGSFNIYEVEYHGELSRKVVKSHTVNRDMFEKIAESLKINYDIYENDGFIRCSFKN